jgi:hypothetical protein
MWSGDLMKPFYLVIFLLSISTVMANICEEEISLQTELERSDCFVTLKKDFKFSAGEIFSRTGSMTMAVKKKYYQERIISAGSKLRVSFVISNGFYLIHDSINYIALGADRVSKRTIEESGELKLDCRKRIPQKM